MRQSKVRLFKLTVRFFYATVLHCRQCVQGLMHKPVCKNIQEKAFGLLSSPENYFESFDPIRIYRKLSSGWISEFPKNKLRANQLSAEKVEPYIFDGYRPSCSFVECIGSLFWLNNESFNCWSHIFGIPLVLHFILEEASQISPDSILLIYLVTALCFVSGSSFAHTFCCHKSLTYNTSFIVDYIGLTIFSHGSGIAYVCYAFPIELNSKRGLLGFSVLESYMLILCLCSSFCIWQSVWTRTLPASLFRSMLRVGAFACPGILMSCPVLYKIFACANAVVAYPTGYCDSTELWPKQFLCCVIGIFFYVSHFPERIFPGTFDLLGHSHNIFHVAAIVGLCYQKEALTLDMKFAKSHGSINSHLKLPIACLLFLIGSIISTCIYFRHVFIPKTLKHTPKL